MILCSKCKGTGAKTYWHMGKTVSEACEECESTGQRKVPVKVKETKKRKAKEVNDGRKQT